MNKMIICGLCACVVLGGWGSATVWANSAPVVSNVTASQRLDDSKLVDIYYDLADANEDPCTVWVVVSDDNGTTWRVPARSFSGDVGQGIPPGMGKAVVWDAGADMPGRTGSFKARVYADDGNGTGPMVLVPEGWFPYRDVIDPEDWVYVDRFQIDKYEVANQFYCQFLNNADPNGDHWVSDMEIDRYGDPGNYYYTVVTGWEDYPIRWATLNDAQAFATWRSDLEGATYRLPTEHEWEKAAGWDPVEQYYYWYCFHQDIIDCTWCNLDTCFGHSIEVGHYDGTGGTNDAKSYYGCYDMSGNVYEWSDDPNGVLRGGAFNSTEIGCRTRERYLHGGGRGFYTGFRLVRELD